MMMTIMMMLQTMVVLTSMIQLIAVAFVVALLSTAFRNLVEVVVASKQKKTKRMFAFLTHWCERFAFARKTSSFIRRAASLYTMPKIGLPTNC